MRSSTKRIEQYRLTDGPFGTDASYGMCGAFAIPRGDVLLQVIASDGDGWLQTGMPLPVWEHVSVSLPDRCPTWDEMDFVKRLFWTDDETVLQLHVPRGQHVNFHLHCLHLWKPVGADLPLPPTQAVGPLEAAR